MSIASGMMSSAQGRASAKEANKTNRDSAKETNALNLRMFRETRGSKGSAVLPLYLKTKGGQLFEKQLGADLVDAYDTLAPRSLDEYRGVVGRTDGIRDMALGKVRGMFDGGLEREALDRFEPVREARVAQTRQASIEGLNRTLAQIDAAQAGKGFASDSMGDRMMRLQANLDASGMAAAVDIANIEEERAIRDRYADLAVANVNMPYDMARRELDYFSLPEDAYMDAAINRMEPLNFIKIGAGQAYRQDRLPEQVPLSSGLGIAAQGMAGVGNMALNYYLNNKAATNYQNMAAQNMARQNAQTYQSWETPNTSGWGTANQIGGLINGGGGGGGGGSGLIDAGQGWGGNYSNFV